MDNADTGALPAWISVAEAADLARYHPQHIRELARKGVVRARRFGRRAWQIERDSLLRYVEGRRAEGQKRGPKSPDSD